MRRPKINIPTGYVRGTEGEEEYKKLKRMSNKEKNELYLQYLQKSSGKTELPKALQRFQ